MNPVMARHPDVYAPDSRRPYAVDTRALGRRPGTMWEGTLHVPAPAGLGRDLVRVPVGSDVELSLRLETVLDGVLATVRITTDTTGECARCLDDVGGVLSVGLTELFSYPEQADRYARTSGDDSDDEVRHLDGDLLDLEQSIRDAVVLALPASPLCRPDCAGLCPRCGEHLDELGPEHSHEDHDPRWGALRGLVDTAVDPTDHLIDHPTVQHTARED